MVAVSGSSFVDEHGRTLMFRGANVGGSNKVPRTPDGATHVREGFFDHRNVSFVGRPFPLEEADEHFARLNSWGLTFLRLQVTWEAVEHTGPGRYDEDYLDYLRAIVVKANEHGMLVLIDPHQDVWSRWCGGDGAPGWTLDTVGLDIRNLDETGAAITHQVQGDPFPHMIWPTNSGKLAAATMFTLFFGGSDFAPRTTVQGEPVQEYLQRHYIDAVCAVAKRLEGLPNVVGYGTMNEPLPGFIGWKDLNAPGGIVTLGNCPTAFQGMLLGSGIPQRVGEWRMGFARIRRVAVKTLNPKGARAWCEGHECVWRQNGVWDLDHAGRPTLLRPDHFTRGPAGQIDFTNDYYHPFARRFASAIRAVDPNALIFIEAESHRLPPRWSESDARGVVFAPHWYDDIVLARKRFPAWMAVDSHVMKVAFGPGAVRCSLRAQLARLKEGAMERAGGIPTLLAEFGIPFDFSRGRAYRTGDFRSQLKALDRSFTAIEDNLLGCTIWNYCADNTNARGDQWNGEDMSIWSRDQRADIRRLDSGGRGLRAFVRPYPRAVAGEVVLARFDMGRRVFELAFRHDPRVTAPTEIFIPRLQYPDGFLVEVSDGEWRTGPDRQVLEYRHGMQRAEHFIRVRPEDRK
ncbi:MAG: cellulase family glycosylhydrolase [Spirochaetia bacterium]|jgi:hypothetical protein